jgi:hypothetical protein
MPSSLAYQPLKANRLISVTDAVPVVPRTTMDAAASARLFDLCRLWWGGAGCEQDSRREPRKQESTEIKRTFDRRTGDLNGSLPVLLVLFRRWRITENARFSPRISQADGMLISMLSEPTDVGACRSTLAVHVTSRQWFSFPD